MNYTLIVIAFALVTLLISGIFGLQRLSRYGDATGLLIAFTVPLFIIPSPYVFSQFGGTASPAMIFSLLLFYVWIMSFIHPSLAKYRKPNALHTAWLFFFAAMLASTAAAFARSLQSHEIQAPYRGLVIIFGFSGIMLASMDGIKNRVFLEQILRAFVYVGSFVALVGIIQYFTGFDLAARIRIPGLSIVNSGQFISSRNGLRRVSGTAYHPIEYATVLCALLPVAWYVARWSYREQRRHYDYIPLIIIALGIPFSLSRTAVVALAVAGICLLPIFTIQQKINVAAYSILFIGFLAVIQRRVFRTFIHLFSNPSQDDSITGRTKDYEVIGSIMNGHSWFGRGLKTFDPQQYFFIDNQFLLGYIETGYIGVIAVSCLVVIALIMALRVRAYSSDLKTRELAQVLFASVASIYTCFITFDTLSFPMIGLMLFFEIGLIGALSRLQNVATFGIVDSLVLQFSPKRNKKLLSAQSDSNISQGHNLVS